MQEKSFLSSKKRRKMKGAITIEYAMVFPLVILCVMGLIYMGLVYYQQALLQAVTSEHAQNWAFLWGYHEQKIDSIEGVITREAYQSKGLYWQIFSGTNRKKAVIADAIRQDYNQRSLLNAVQDITVDISYQNFLITQKVGVRVSAIYPAPFKGFLQSVGVSGDIKLEAYSEATVHDPKEFIYNVDYLLQIYEETGAKDWVSEKCKPLIDSLRKIKGYFK